MTSDHSARQPLAPLVLFAACALLLLCAAPQRAATSAGQESEAGARDPVVVEVLRLLESGIGEPVILRWLAEESRPPGRPTADELVALKRAGASDELIAALLDRARQAGPEPAPPAAAEPASTPAPAPTPPATAPPPAPPAADAPVALALSTLYIHWPDEGEPRDLVVYLDGRPFAPVPAARSARTAVPHDARRELAPGVHVLRWAQERHAERPGERGRHAARFDPEPLVFTLAPGAPAAIDFAFRDPSGVPFASAKGPVTVRVRQGDREIAARLEGGGDPFLWPDLCEEIEANLGGGKPSLQERLLLKSCRRWPELWTDLPGGAPARDEVRTGPAAAP